MQRLGKNVHGYAGDRIEIQAVLRDIKTAARNHGWSQETFCQTGGFDLIALHRPATVLDPSHPTSRTYLSTGIHGDEPAGPWAVHQLLQENRWPPNLDLWLCPCLNPTGFELNRRENDHGIDLNRQYRQPQAKETVAHVAWLERQPGFDLCLCLHEDWEAHGFYIYELNLDHQIPLAEPIVQRVAQVCPIDTSEMIEGRPAKNGIIRPSPDPRSRPDWPEAFYLLTNKTRLSYTLEAPSDFPLPVRVSALVTGVNTALELMARKSG
jgi:hypothetical protein